jgi:hypothetical protein
MGFQVGIITNVYFSTTEEDDELWLKPLAELGIAALNVSDDAFHFNEQDNLPKHAARAARKLGIPVGSICIEQPMVSPDIKRKKGEPIVGGGVMFRGRAVEKLTEGLPRAWWDEFAECPYEDLQNPERIHIDAYGNVHLCQGLSMGNVWQIPLSTLVRNYNVSTLPIAGHLVRGGPALLVKEYNAPHEDTYVDACHMCYRTRQMLINWFPQFIAPRHVYGLT